MRSYRQVPRGPFTAAKGRKYVRGHTDAQKWRNPPFVRPAVDAGALVVLCVPSLFVLFAGTWVLVGLCHWAYSFGEIRLLVVTPVGPGVALATIVRLNGQSLVPYMSRIRQSLVIIYKHIVYLAISLPKQLTLNIVSISFKDFIHARLCSADNLLTTW